MKQLPAGVLPNRLAGFGLSVLLMSVAAQAQAPAVEDVAQEIARQHNANAKAMLDGMTVSTSARAEGVNVIITHVLRVTGELPKREREEFRKGIGAEVVRAACKANVGNEAFQRGLYYTFVYRDTNDQLISELEVSKGTCSKIK